MLLVPGAERRLRARCWGWARRGSAGIWRRSRKRCPQALYALGDVPAEFGGARGALAWVLGTYRFDRYRKKQHAAVAEAGAAARRGRRRITRIAESVFLARDLVNTPANDMGPEELAAAARDLAKKHGAKVSRHRRRRSAAKNYPLIHAVGRASRARRG